MGYQAAERRKKFDRTTEETGTSGIQSDAPEQAKKWETAEIKPRRSGRKPMVSEKPGCKNSAQGPGQV